MAHAFDAFIFDLDGTLLDTLSDLVVLTNKALESAGFPTHTREQIASYVGNGAAALMKQAVPAGADTEQAAFALQQWKDLYPRYGYNHTEPFPGMLEALHDLKAAGVRLGALSNKYDEAVKNVIGHYLPDTFGTVHGECDQIPRKPDPTGLLFTIEELGSTPERSVYVGDSPGDMVVARNAGCFALGVSWGYRSVDALREAGADAIVDSPAQFIELAAL